MNLLFKNLGILLVIFAVILLAIYVLTNMVSNFTLGMSAVLLFSGLSAYIVANRIID